MSCAWIPTRKIFVKKRDNRGQCIHNTVMYITKVQWNYLQECYGFTERQMQILELLSDGQDSNAISRRLKIRYNTVKAHLGHMYKRTGAQNKADLIVQLFSTVQAYSKSKDRRAK